MAVFRHVATFPAAHFTEGRTGQAWGQGTAVGMQAQPAWSWWLHGAAHGTQLAQLVTLGGLESQSRAGR